MRTEKLWKYIFQPAEHTATKIELPIVNKIAEDGVSLLFTILVANMNISLKHVPNHRELAGLRNESTSLLHTASSFADTGNNNSREDNSASGVLDYKENIDNNKQIR